MAKEKFILVSLKDNESKKLAQIVTNDTSRKILDHLAEKESTESEISTKLNIPISTIHYNLQMLVKARLVEADEYHYSKKGKEVLHYKLANKYIIIAPKSTYGIKERLKSILPVGILILIGSVVIHFLNSTYGFFGKATDKVFTVAPQMARVAEIVEEEAAIEAQRMLKTVADDATDMAANAAGAALNTTAPPALPHVISEPSIWQTFLQEPALWFLFGCIFTLLLIILGEYIHYKRKK